MRRAGLLDRRVLSRGRSATAGGGAAAASATDPLSIVTSVTPFFFLTADVGFTPSTWTDQSGNGRDATQGTGANQPVLVTADAHFGGRNSVQPDGLDDFMDIAWDPPAPGTTPIWFLVILHQISYTTGRYIWAGATAAATLALLQEGTTPAMTMRNATLRNSNTGAAIGTSVRGEVYYSNSTSDYLKLGSTSVNDAATAGNSDAAIFRLFNRNGSNQGAEVKIAAIGAWAGQPGAAEKTSLSAWVTSYYGAGVGV